MIILPDNAAELANLARDIGAEVLKGHLRYPSETGGWRAKRSFAEATSISMSTWRISATSPVS